MEGLTAHRDFCTELYTDLLILRFLCFSRPVNSVTYVFPMPRLSSIPTSPLRAEYSLGPETLTSTEATQP